MPHLSDKPIPGFRKSGGSEPRQAALMETLGVQRDCSNSIRLGHRTAALCLSGLDSQVELAKRNVHIPTIFMTAMATCR
jgi:hypothetical protein